LATFTNQATLSFNNNLRSSNIVTGEIQDVITATKTAVQSNYSVGDTITYAVNIVNSSDTAFKDISVTDNLGAYEVGTPAVEVTPLTYIPGSVYVFEDGVSSTTAAVGATTPPLSITNINVPASGVATVIYSARVNEYAPLDTDSSITNIATIAGTGLAANIEADYTTTVSEDPNLYITKSVNPTTIVGNGPITYTFVLSNTGNTVTDANDDIVITDTFDPILNITSVTYNGQVLTLNTDYAYDTGTGLFTADSAQIIVPAATYTQDQTTGVVSVEPGTGTLVVTGTIQ